MSKTKHTPGPWRWSRRSGGHFFDVGPEKPVGDADREKVAMLVPGVANARLIAAAPDLLSAAEEVLAGLNARLDQARDAGQPMPVFGGIAALHTAIHKAKGG